MTAKELWSLDIDSKTEPQSEVCHILRSAITGMCEENAELQEKLAEVDAKLVRESQELAEVQERTARDQQEAERERHCAESLEAELRAVRLEAEVDKLREIEVIRTSLMVKENALIQLANMTLPVSTNGESEWRLRRGGLKNSFETVTVRQTPRPSWWLWRVREVSIMNQRGLLTLVYP